MASGVTPSSRYASSLVTISISQVDAEGLEDQVGLPVPAVVQRTDDPTGTMPQVPTVGCVARGFQLTSKRAELSGDVGVLLLDAADSGTEPPGSFRRDHGEQRVGPLQFSLLLGHGFGQGPQTGADLIDPVLSAGCPTQGHLEITDGAQGSVPIGPGRADGILG